MIKQHAFILKSLLVAALLTGGANYVAWADSSTETTTETNEDDSGKTVITTTTTTQSGDGDSSSSSGGGSSSDSSSGSGSSSDGTSSGGSSSGGSSSSDTEESEDSEDVNYTGVFNERQIVPNKLAIFCKTNAEDMLKNNAKLYNCINKLAMKINNKDAATRTEGLQDYGAIRFEELKIMLSQAITAGATISNYENIQNSIGEAVSDTKTEHEDNVAIANASSTLTDVINTMRNLYAERLKMDAISGINTIDPEVIADIEEDEAEEEDSSSGSSSSDSSKKIVAENSWETVEYTTENPYTTAWSYVKDNICSRQVCTGEGETINDLTCATQEETCLDGTYELGNNQTVVCVAGSCYTYNKSSEDACGSLSEVSGYTLITGLSGTAMCSNGSEQVECPDGLYYRDGTTFACQSGSCTVCLDEVVVTASGSN